MRKAVFAVALVGVIASVAILAQSQMKDDAQSETGMTPQTQADSQLPSASPVAVQPESAEGKTYRPPTAAASGPDDQARTTPESQASAPADEQRNPAADVLRKASSTYSSVRSLRADFVQKRDNPLLGSTTTSRGTLYQKRPDRFLMKFSDPSGDVIVSDGQYFWLYYPSADPRQVLRAPSSEGAAGGADLQAQFLGDPLKRFTHTYHGTEKVGGRTAHVITLVPRENLGYRSLKVWIDATDSMVRRFVLTENNGLVQEFQLSRLEVNPTLSNDLFRFTPPPDARVVERP